MNMIDKLVNELKCADEERRIIAAEQLGNIGNLSAVRPLVTALIGSNWRVRKSIVEALLKLQNQQVIQTLVEAFGDSDAGLRNSAFEFIIKVGVQASGALITALTHPDRDVRLLSADALGQIKDKSAVEPLIERLLNDKDDNVCYSCIQSLGEIGDSRAIEYLISIAESDNFWLKNAAIESLGKIGDKSAVRSLLKLLDHRFTELSSVYALGKIGDFRAVIPLVQRLGTDDPELRNAVSCAIVEIAEGQKRFDEIVHQPEPIDFIAETIKEYVTLPVVQMLSAQLSDAEPYIRRCIYSILGWSKYTECIEILVHQLSDEQTTEEVINSIVQHGDVAIPILTQNITHPDYMVRRSIPIILGKLGNPSASKSLIKLLTDQDGHVRQYAAQSLKLFPSPEAVTTLVDTLYDIYADVRKAAKESLVVQDRELVIKHVTPLLDAVLPYLRESAIYILSRLQPDNLNNYLSKALKDEDKTVRKTALQSICGCDIAVTPELVINALSDEDEEVRKYAVIAAGKLRLLDAIDYLKLTLKDDDIWVRCAVCKSLGKIATDESINILLEELNNNHPEPVIISILDALVDTGAERVFLPIVELLSSEDIEIQKTVIRCLGRLGNKEAIKHILPFLTHPHYQVRESAVQSLGELITSEYIDKLLSALQDCETVQRAAINSLSKLADVRAIDALVPLLKDSRLQPYVFNALVQIGKKHLHEITKVLSYHKDVDIIRFIIYILIKIGATQTIPLIKRLLNHPDDEVRRAAGTALVYLGGQEVLVSICDAQKKESEEYLQRWFSYVIESRYQHL